VPALASVARSGLSTIVDFERSRRPVSSEAAQAIREALELAGVEFINENGAVQESDFVNISAPSSRNKEGRVRKPGTPGAKRIHEILLFDCYV